MIAHAVYRPFLSVLPGLLALGCAGSDPGSAPVAPAEPDTAAPQVASPAPAARPAVQAPDEQSEPAGPAGAGHDFAAQAALIYRMAACGKNDPLPPKFPAKAVKRHCQRMHKHMARYQKRWAEPAGAFIAALRPADVPDRVVYPFGGGDLVSALVVYPEAREITTVSLEAAGDPRPIDRMSKKDLAADLTVIGQKYQRLLKAAHSTTKSLQIASHSKLPGTVVFALAALALHDFEPVSLRYFRIQEDGALHYLDLDALDADDMAARQRRKQKRKKKRARSRQVWREQTAGFANMEIRFRRRNDPDADVRVYRHIVANLDDEHQGEDARLLRHLAQKDKVAVMTKAASYLLWLDEFSLVRRYLLDHAAWMISDSSGIPPELARAAGFEQIPYGEFAGPYFHRDPKRVTKQMIALWQESPKKKLPFRFGYPDMNGNNHMLVMRPAR